MQQETFLWPNGMLMGGYTDSTFLSNAFSFLI
jgi:hypothetical protein